MKKESWSSNLMRSFAAQAAERFGRCAPLHGVEKRKQYIRDRIGYMKQVKKFGGSDGSPEEMRSLRCEFFDLQRALSLRKAQPISEETRTETLQEAAVFSLALRAVMHMHSRAPQADQLLTLSLLSRQPEKVWGKWTNDAVEDMENEYGISLPPESIKNILSRARELLVQTLYVNTAVTA